MSLRNICLLLLCCWTCHSAVAQVDTTIGLKAPRRLTKNPEKLAHFLCDDLQGDAQKVNAIYNWVTHNIRYDVKAMQQGHLKRPTVKEVLKKKKALCDGYAAVFSELCNQAGVPCIVVSGYARDWMFDDSDKFYTPRHAWNAVAVGNSWQLVDATWGAGVIGQFPGWMQRKLNKASKNPVQYSGKLRFKYRYDPAWLMSPVGAFRMKHLPYDPMWQLTDSLMPLYLFEAGEASITTFNERYGRPRLDYSETDRFVQQPEHIRTIEEAERAYGYNPRFHVSMAMRHQGNAIDSIASMDRNAAPAIREQMIGKVKQELKTAESYVALQKKSIASEYSELKKKNKAKNTAAKAHLRTINNNNKQAIARCKAKISSGDNKHKNVQGKAGTAMTAHKKVNAASWDKIKTTAKEDAPDVPRLQQLQDSVLSRASGIKVQEQELQMEQRTIESLARENDLRLDTLVAWLRLADSALVQETIGRINMEDNYDAPVKKWSGLYREARFNQADTLQRHYLATYDSVLVHYELLRKQQARQLEQYRKNFKDLEQYKKRNRSNAALLSSYTPLMNGYNTAFEQHRRTLAMHSAYIKDNKGLFEKLAKHYERQEKLAGYMDKAEEHRQKLEEQTLTKKEDFDKKENEYQKRVLEETAQKAERILSKSRKG